MWTQTQQKEVTSSNRFKAWRLVVSQTLAIDQSCGPCNLLVRVKRTPWWRTNNKPGGLWVFQHLKLHRENTLANGSSSNFYTSQWEVPNMLKSFNFPRVEETRDLLFTQSCFSTSFSEKTLGKRVFQMNEILFLIIYKKKILMVNVTQSKIEVNIHHIYSVKG